MQGSAGASIWSNNTRPDNLSGANTTGTSSYISSWAMKNTGLTDATASTQRSSGLGATDGNIWAARSSWNTADSQPFRPSASRSTSPPNPVQHGSNASPSFPNRGTNMSNTMASNYLSSYTPTANTQPGYSNYTDTTPVNSGLFANLGPFQARAVQGNSMTQEDDFLPLPPSRHSESGAPSQTGNDMNPSMFSTGFSSHSRHGSRMSLGGHSTYAPPQVVSRSQSQSFLQGSEQSQAALEAVQQHLLRGSIPSNSAAPRLNASHTSIAGPNAWPEYAPIGSASLQDPRRDSLATNSQHASTNTCNSPRNLYGSRQADPWEAPPTLQDLETTNRLQKQLGQARQGNPAPYTDPAYNGYATGNLNIQSQQLLQMQQQMQQVMHQQMQQQMQNGFSGGYTSYGFPPAQQQQFFAPTGPAGMMFRGRSQDSTVGIRCPELEEFRRSRSNKNWELKVGLFPLH